MNISELKESRFLKKEDCGKNGIIVTIKGLTQENVARADAPEEMKHCLLFEEDLAPLVLNSVNAQLIASITGEQDTDQWPGHKIVLYNDPTIMFAGKLTGGIRARAPKSQPAKPKPTPTPPVEPESAKPGDGEEVPF